MKYKIFIVEDDVSLGQAIKTSLDNWDFETQLVSDFQNIIKQYSAFDPHLILMDLKLPYKDGYYWCQEIRKNSAVPIIFISSASENMNIIMAMNLGGDDFVAKPFEQEVLVAKINALIRRTYNFSENTSIIEHNGLIINTDNNKVEYNNQNIELTKNEYKILVTLIQNKGKIVSREKLMETLWSTDLFVDENTLTVNVTRLRKKLESIGLSDIIKTKVKQGYIIP